MKDDHMKNGQLKAGYNIQLSTSKQFIVDYSTHPNPGDTTTLPKHIEQHKTTYRQYPDSVTTDAGYGSEENYQYLEAGKIEGIVKFAVYEFASSQLMSIDVRKDTKLGMRVQLQAY
jgi:hypothetical protein